MSILENQVVVDGVYLTTTKQLRKVTAIIFSKDKRKRVTYFSKSENFPNRPWEIIHNKSKSPLISTFAKACSKRIK
jgi:hypothetical protein